MKFSELAHYFKRIDETNSRNDITVILAELFEKTSVQEIQEVAYLLQGRVAPAFEKLDFGIAEKMLIRAIIHSLSVEPAFFKKQFEKLGDLGLVVEELKKDLITIESHDYSVSEVFQKLREVAHLNGTGSQEKKVGILSDLITKLDPLSCRYLVRIPTGTLRLGFSDLTVLDAYSWMLTGDKKLRSQIDAVYHVKPDLGLIGKTLKEKGIKGVHYIIPSVFTPILMMRAERLANTKEIIEKLGTCAVESKFDGFRLQVHYQNGKVKLFSRNLDEVSYMYPDIVKGVQDEIKAKEAIFEGEAIGFNPQTYEFLPFQETVQRKRKHGIEGKALEIPLKLFIFDVLYIEGDSLLNAPYSERHEKLSHVIEKGDVQTSTLQIAQSILIDDPDKLEILFEKAITDGLEGIVAKKLSGIYQAGARGFNWIKFKKSYSSHLQDTIDCVVMGYDYGKGKRTGFGLGAFLVGVYNDKKDQFETVSKVGTGLTDEEWKQLKARIDKGLESSKQPAMYNVEGIVLPDVWIKPSIVVEIRADEISRSPVHTAGKQKIGDTFEPGYALRFPRLERFRDDKLPTDATTVKEVEALFKLQHTHQP